MLNGQKWWVSARVGCRSNLFPLREARNLWRKGKGMNLPPFSGLPTPGLMQNCLIHNANQQVDGSVSSFFRQAI